LILLETTSRNLETNLMITGSWLECMWSLIRLIFQNSRYRLQQAALAVNIKIA
jgi:ABC-type uncharacterized transport system permease subunit